MPRLHMMGFKILNEISITGYKVARPIYPYCHYRQSNCLYYIPTTYYMWSLCGGTVSPQI